MSQNKEYNASQITVLEGLEAVRKRPGMYIGSTSIRGLHHLIYEIVDNSIDEAMGGYCNEIDVTIHKDRSVTVKDNGRGIPVDIHPKAGIPAVELVMTTLHAGGKFGGDGYQVSGGLHGVGASVVNALSDWCTVEIHKNGNSYRQTYERGKTTSPLSTLAKSRKTGTTVTFMPDKTIFETLDYDFDVISQRLRELAFLTKDVKISVEDKRSNKKSVYLYRGGVSSYVEFLNRSKDPIHKKVIYMQEKFDTCEVEVALQYTDSYNQDVVYTFANNINTEEGGTHLSGFRSALTRSVNNYLDRAKLAGKDKKMTLSGDDVREGLTAIVSVRVREPQFEGQTKTKLGNSEIRGVVDGVVSRGLDEFFEENPPIARKIIEKCINAAKVREAAKNAKDLARRKTALENSTLPGKLADCSDRNPENTEIFVVEGDSAGGSAKQGRDRKFQAILPLRGKILNVEKARLDRVLGNEEIKAMITAMGTGVGSAFDITKARYHKFIIMTDADVDGAHICTLMLTFLFRHMRPLIDEGYVYIARPPLFRLKAGSKEVYIYREEEMEEAMAQFPNRNTVNIQRYKGLGEMNPEQLWDTTMNPDTRVLYQVSIQDAIEADEIMTILMGDKVEPRRDFISENAKYVRNLDV